jgi:hypothetical protein
MDADRFREREQERADRLLTFVKGELANMVVHSRMNFTVDLFNYLTPEIRCLLRDKRIDPPEAY